MRVAYVIAVWAVLLVFGQVRSWTVRGSLRKAFASVTLATCLSSSTAVLAQDADPAAVNALEQVLRVQKSLKFVDETINNEGNPSSVVSQINLLLRNYKLKDNVRLSLSLIADGTRREEARTHGVAAIEDLQLVSEYFDDDINDTTGQKTPPRAVLQLAVQATAAANKELGDYKSLFPSEIMSDSVAKIAQEFQ